MTMKATLTGSMFCLGLLLSTATSALAQNGDFPPGPPQGFDGPPPFGPDGPRFGGPGGPGGFGGPGPQQKLKIAAQFDKNGDNILDKEERKAALEFLEKERANRPNRRGGPGRFGPGGPQRDIDDPTHPGQKVSQTDVKTYGAESLYDPAVVRTIFIQFDTDGWEKEMAAFKNSDVEMPAKVTVDGKTYADVGIHFRGASSFMMVGAGQKRSLNLSFDSVHKDQNLLGYHSLELLNSHEDPSFLRSVLSYQIEREYLPAPKANFVRVVINGESWGIYVNSQAFNKDLIKDNFGTPKGARWKTPGSPNGRATLKYLGDDAAKYKGIYEIKSKDDAKSWSDLIHLTKVLTETPADKLEAELSPIFDVDGALRFLALENALINNDGYWIRSSDYSIYQDTKGKFHIIPHDSNETFARPESPGGPGGRGRPRFDNNNGDRPNPNQVKGVELDPLFAAKDENKVLVSKLLAVPAWRAKYLGYMRDIAEKWLDWNKLGPIATKYHSLIAEDIKADTRKLDPTEDFAKSLTEDIPGRGGFGPFGRGTIALKNFADQRREYLLKATAQ